MERSVENRPDRERDAWARLTRKDSFDRRVGKVWACRDGRPESAVVEFERTTFIPLAIDAAFDLSLNIDAHVGSMAASGERVLAGVAKGIIAHGEFVTWQARHFGVTWRMTSQITEWDRPHRFVDEQARGPFKSFWHEHVFSEVDNGTELRDRIRFEAPLGVLGRFAERVVLGRYMPHLIDVRNAYLVEAAGRMG